MFVFVHSRYREVASRTYLGSQTSTGRVAFHATFACLMVHTMLEDEMAFFDEETFGPVTGSSQAITRQLRFMESRRDTRSRSPTSLPIPSLRYVVCLFY